eukprot:TRINITY_DN5943_c0_g1_i5.p1 TRINITY_DN5943_c0_g1~~TRINITY_DN5943_c0_g1_i5.p1  ORF type:complete len:423 (+),score=58.65 TRINITY_DN5943_c0_g1_i5:2-1270(+)
MYQPAGIAVSPQGSIFVSDYHADRLIKEMAAYQHVALIHQLMRPSRRESFRRVLMAFAVKYPHCGVNAAYASFIGVALIMAENEEAAFKLAVALYERLHLNEYFGSSKDTTTGLQVDIDLIVDMLRTAVPELTAAFDKYNASDLLESLAKKYLTCLFANGLSFREDETGRFSAQILDRLMTRWGDTSDPRRFLRWIVVCAISSQSITLQRAAKRGFDHFRVAVESSPRHLRTDENLLAMVDVEVDVEYCRWLNALSFAPVGVGLGVAFGLEISADSTWGVVHVAKMSVEAASATWTSLGLATSAFFGIVGGAASSHIGWLRGEEIARARIRGVAEMVPEQPDTVLLRRDDEVISSDCDPKSTSTQEPSFSETLGYDVEQRMLDNIDSEEIRLETRRSEFPAIPPGCWDSSPTAASSQFWSNS